MFKKIHERKEIYEIRKRKRENSTGAQKNLLQRLSQPGNDSLSDPPQ